MQTNTPTDVGSVEVERETAFKVERSGESVSPRLCNSKLCSRSRCMRKSAPWLTFIRRKCGYAESAKNSAVCLSETDHEIGPRKIPVLGSCRPARTWSLAIRVSTSISRTTCTEPPRVQMDLVLPTSSGRCREVSSDIRKPGPSSLIKPGKSSAENAQRRAIIDLLLGGEPRACT